MAVPALHLGATVLCIHGGQASPTSPDTRVLVSGQPVVPVSSLYTVAGCPLPSQAGGPCVSAQFVSAATRVTASGQPLLLTNSQAVCTPTGTGVNIVASQVRVTAT